MGWRRRSRHFFPLVCCRIKNGFGEQLLVGGAFWGLFFFATRGGFQLPGAVPAASGVLPPSSPARHRLRSPIPPPHTLPSGSDGDRDSAVAGLGGRCNQPVLAIAGGPGYRGGTGPPPSSLFIPLHLPSSFSLLISTWETRKRPTAGGPSSTVMPAGPRGALLIGH